MDRETEQGPDPQAITVLLANWRSGDSAARDELMTVIYREMRRLANHYLRQERPNHTLQPTALVHEVYVRLLASEQVSWQNRAHFFAFAAQMMRRMLVDYARARLAEKRGGGSVFISLEDVSGWGRQNQEILLLDQALDRLAQLDPRVAQVVEARFFGGLKEHEAAEALGISLTTLKRDWQFARAWLYEQLKMA